MVIYEMLTLKMPYEEVDLFEAKSLIMSGSNPVVSKSSLSSRLDSIEKLMEMCLRVDPTERPSSDDILLYLLKLNIT
jgi:serine/threonine protein kinase